ncbi:MAG: OadG family protein [Lentisphaeria bacterium]|nr:OadG family protein [Lentisphaeria bacterium]
MDYGELMAGGIKLMVFGMGMVYVFLVIMIGAMKVLEVALRPFATLLDPPAAAPAAKKPAASSEDANLAAIAAAVVAKMTKK